MKNQNENIYTIKNISPKIDINKLRNKGNYIAENHIKAAKKAFSQIVRKFTDQKETSYKFQIFDEKHIYNVDAKRIKLKEPFVLNNKITIEYENVIKIL